MKDSFTEALPPFVKGSVSLDFQQCPEKGITRLHNGYRTGLFHFSKSYWDDQQLVVQLVNPTAGVFEGDRMESRFSVGTGARACILSPTSTQVYSMPGDTAAESTQHLELREGATCAYIPRWTVLHKGARFRQKTTIDISDTSSLLYVEPLSAGRASFGEFLLFEQLVATTELRINGKLVIKERIECGRDLNRWIWMSRGMPFGYLATAYVHFKEAGAFCEGTFAHGAFKDPAILAGMTALSPDCVVFRIAGTNNRVVQDFLKLICSGLGERVAASSVIQRIL